MEQKLRDVLHDFYKGSYSPLIARDKPTMMSYIHSNMSIPKLEDLGGIYTIMLELHEDIVSLLSNNTSNSESNFNSSRIHEKHWIKRIISDNKKKVTPISYNKARYNKIIKDKQRKNEELSKQDQPVKSQIIKYLFEKILDEKELTQDDLHFSDVEIKDSIFELILITYKKNIQSCQ